MFLRDLLFEKNVTSTWIVDLSNNRTKKIVSMTLNNGRRYEIYNVSRRMFDKWHAASSKGKFWHDNVKGFYSVKRVN